MTAAAKPGQGVHGLGLAALAQQEVRRLWHEHEADEEAEMLRRAEQPERRVGDVGTHGVREEKAEGDEELQKGAQRASNSRLLRYEKGLIVRLAGLP